MPQKPGLGKPAKPIKAMIFWVILVLVLLIRPTGILKGRTV